MFPPGYSERNLRYAFLMCGRYVTPKQESIERVFRTRAAEGAIKQRFNAVPTQLLPVIRAADRELALLRWGLIPSWAKDAKIGAKMNNARGETVAEKPSFRTAFKRRRCIVPMAGFYEWKATPAGKVPHYFSMLNEEQFAVAGLWERWPGTDGAEPIESFTVITTSANAIMEPIHDRMPVILPTDAIDAWLDPESTGDMQALLVPYPADEMQEWTVSTLVNNARNDSAELVTPNPLG